MFSSLPNARPISRKTLEQDAPRVLPCPECGSLAMRRVRGPCTLRDGTIIPDLERLRCSRCRANFFDAAAMQAIAEFRRRLSRKALAGGRR